MDHKEADDIRQAVRESYTKVAEGRADGSGCCAPAPGASGGCCGTPVDFDIASIRSVRLGYSEDEINSVPEGADMGLGCGNPRAIASLKPGEVVLDLGSGGGFDCFLAAREVGPSGRVIGVDMTPEMLSKARANAVKGGFANVEFRLGEIEHLPVADSSIDVIISNCVINLSPDKPQVFREAFRVLKPGGRLAVSDVVATAELPENIRKDLALHSACVAGAAGIGELEAMLRDAGFVNITVTPKDESREFIRDWAPEHRVEDYVVSAYIEAVKPVNCAVNIT
ncbi:MAG: arsenite methyltransferase [Gammaproteobacteria bacterium]